MNMKIEANEVARILGISQSAIARLVANGVLHPIGGQFDIGEVQALAGRRAMPTAARGQPGNGHGPMLTRSGRTPVV
jgi:hypothetical protein